MTEAASVEINRTDRGAEVTKDWFSMKEAIASKHEDGETERFGMKCAVVSQAIKSNEVIKTKYAKERTNQIALIVDGDKYRVKHETTAAVEMTGMKYRDSMHKTNALVQINGYFF